MHQGFTISFSIYYSDYSGRKVKKCIIVFLTSFLESLFKRKQNVSFFSPLDQMKQVCLSYRGFVKIIPEVALLVPPIYTSESGKLSIGKPVKSVGREIKIFCVKQTRSTEEKWYSPFVPSIFSNHCVNFENIFERENGYVIRHHLT